MFSADEDDTVEFKKMGGNTEKNPHRQRHVCTDHLRALSPADIGYHVSQLDIIIPDTPDCHS